MVEEYFKITDEFIAQYSNKQPKWGSLGYITYKRCVDIETPVLCDDLTWKKAGELFIGQGIIGFDDLSKQVYKSKKRYLRHGKVMDNSIEEAETMGIELENGEILYATPDHKWLIKHDSQNHSIEWRETKDLEKNKKGSKIFLLRPFGKPWKEDNTYGGGFVSAAYDGEGNLDKISSISFCQVENGMMKKVETILKEKQFPYTKAIKSNNATYQYKKERQVCYSLRTHSIENIMQFLGTYRPPRLLNKFKENFIKRTSG